MIRNILFDMGGVLLRFNPELFVSRLHLDEADGRILIREIFHSAEWVCLDRGSMTEDEAFASMCTRIPERLHAAAREVFDNWDKPRLAMDGATELVRDLSERGYGLYLLSNAGERHAQYWPDLPMARYFGDRLMVSYRYQLLKPDAAFYEKAFELFSLDRRECLFIDDNPCNIEAAWHVGLDGIVYHGDPPLLRQRLREKGVDI
ncbi:MAG: HAD family phosphatase [Ruminococcaceae bacterium]|nr:HAD family phosphatase [Oscillospiraceae bacterium]